MEVAPRYELLTPIQLLSYQMVWREGQIGINQGLAAALRAPPSGLFIALVIQIPAVTALSQRALVARGGLSEFGARSN